MDSPGARTLEIGPARLPEASEIAAISRRTVEAGLPWQWRASRVAACIRHENTCVLVAREGRRVVGFALMSFRFEEGEAHLLLLAVAPERRRAGLATRLVRWLEVLARRGGLRRIELEVREGAQPARSFYAARGYVQRSRLRGYYQGREDALLLWKTL
jgi:ribosomal-protein-alanine N-acetyltransferase